MGWEVQLTDEARHWLETCHRDRKIRESVQRRFLFAFGMLRESGPLLGEPKVRRVVGYENLWEVRVNHAAGAFRAFFGLARTGAVIVVACGAVKKSDRFRPEVYRNAERRVAEAVAALADGDGGGEGDGR